MKKMAIALIPIFLLILFQLICEERIFILRSVQVNIKWQKHITFTLPSDTFIWHQFDIWLFLGFDCLHSNMRELF